MAFYKRSTFLIDKDFQLRFCLMVSSLIFLSSLIFPVIFIDFIEELSKAYPALDEVIREFRTNIFYIMIPIQFLFLGLVFLLMIFLTHKIAGPMYKLKEHLASIREGEGIRPLSFRQGDYFHDVASEVTVFLESVENKQREDFEYLDEVAIYIDNLAPAIPDDKKPVLHEISRRLNEISQRYKKDQ